MNVKVDLKGLEDLIETLSKGAPSIKVGILGSDRGDDTGGDNATVGAAHEFGTSKMTQRSFLRMPLEKKFFKDVQKAGFVEKQFLQNLKSSKSFVEYAQKIGSLAVETVKSAFDSNGFGLWAPWKNESYENNTGQILVDTQQLRNSITYQVKEPSND